MKFLQVFLFFSLALVFASAWSNPANCGIRREPPTEAQLGIFNGDLALPHEFPWIVSIKLWGQHNCGGAILNDRWILTAAHCIRLSQKRSDYSVIAGAHNLTDHREKTQVRSVERLFPHPLFNHVTDPYDYDLALIKLSKPLDLNAPNGTIAPVCLPTTPSEDLDAHAGDLATAIGWGNLIGGVKPVESPLLHKVNLTISSNEFCQEDLASLTTVRITRRMLCTNGRHRSSVCKGDSGSPVSLYTKGRWTVYGVVSVGRPCTDNTTYSGINARVTEFMPWIEKIIADN